MTTIVHKRGIGIPSADDLSVGEIAIDTSTGTAYTKNNAGEVVPVGGDSGGGEIDDSNYVKLDDDNQIGSEFYLHNADWTFSISDGEVFSQYVVGQHIAVGGEGYRSIKSDLNRVGYDAFAVINSDGSQSMSINQAGVVQAQDFLDAEGNSIVGGEFDNSHTDDNKNVSVGVNALVSNENGYDNTAVGQWSLISNTSGADNTGIGFNAGGYNDTGSRNTSVGSKALLNPTASDNTAVGFDALGTLEDGSDGCTAVGSNAGVDANGATLQNATAIGYQAKVDADNKVQLGNSDVTLVHTHGAMQAQDYLDADGNSIIGGGGTELPEGSSDGSVLTWQTDAWKPSQKFQFQEKPTNEIVAGTSGITLAATDAETKLDLNLNGFEFSHGYQPARVWIKKNPYESDPSELHVDQVFATDYLDADGNSIIGGGGGGDVDLTGYATETWVSANYQVKGNYLTSETDPVFQASVAAGITQTDINNWNNNSGGGSYTLPLAGNGTRGGVQTGFTTSGRNYAVQLSGEKMYVNVPWTDSGNTTYGPATSSVYGLVKIGYSANGKNYPVQLSNGQMYVNVPWTDSGGSSYTQGNGISIANNTISMSGQYSSNSPFLFDYSGNNTSLHIASNNARGAEIWLNSGSNDANKYMRANPNGNWEVVNGPYSAVLLAVNNSGDLTATGDVMAYSDERLKDNIETLDGSKVYEMRGVSYTKDGREGSGVIAQELQKVAPELVSDDGEYLTVAYGNLVGYLIEAVKDLKAEVEELKRGL